jgi:5-aminopentanamidase
LGYLKEKNIMKIGYVQFNPEFGNIPENVKKVCSMLENTSADLIVLPELFNTGYYITEKKELEELGEEIPHGYTCRKLISLAEKLNTYLVAGILERANDRYYNSAVLIGKEGYIDHYRKIHLFNEEKLYFTPGDKPFRVYNIGMAKTGIMICYDWIYPESVRILSLLGADIICHCANLVLPYCPKIMPSRSFENKIFVITANRCGMDVKGEKSMSFIGQSAVTAPDGSVLKNSGTDDESVEVIEIDPEKARNKRMNKYNDLFADRRPEMYEVLTMQAERLEKLK